MAKHRGEQFAELLERLRESLNLVPLVGGGGGHERALLAWYPLVDQEQVGIKRQIENLDIDPQKIRKRPILGSDPCLHGFTLRPFRDEQTFISRLESERLCDVLRDSAVWNPMHLRHGIRVAATISRLCGYNGFDGTVRISDATLAHRVWQIAFPMQSTTDYGPNLDHTYEMVIREKEGSQPSVRRRIHGNRTSSTLNRKHPTPTERRYELLGLTTTVEDRRARLALAAAEDEVYHELRPLLDEQAWVKPSKRELSLPFERSVAISGNLGRAEVSTVIAACRYPQSRESAIVATMVVAMLHEDDWQSATIEQMGPVAIITTRLNGKYASVEGFSANLHRQASLSFQRAIPADLAQTYLEAVAGKSLEQLHVEVEAWLDSIVEGCTLAKLRTALLYNGPLWLGYPSSYAHAGLNARDSTMSGWRYYCQFSLRDEWARVSPLLNLISSRMDFRAMEPPDLTSGSQCVPKTETIYGIVQLLHQLLEEPVPIGSADLLVCRWNGIAGLAHVLLMGFLFIRNYPYLPPELVLGQDWRMTENTHLIYQKSLLVVWFPLSIRRLLSKLRNKWCEFENALKAQQLAINYRASFNRAYGFWSLPSKTVGKRNPVTSYQEPCRWQIVNGLVHCRETEYYAGLHYNAMRHWTVTTLLKHPAFSLGEVNWIHGHGSRLAQPTSEYRLEPANPPVKERAFAYLSSLVDFSRLL